MKNRDLESHPTGFTDATVKYFIFNPLALPGEEPTTGKGPKSVDHGSSLYTIEGIQTH